jgi:uncharacterized protein
MPLNSPTINSPTIDSFELARSGRKMSGDIPVERLARLGEFLSSANGTLHYRINGLILDDGAAGADLELTATLPLVCQRCSESLEFKLDRTVRFRFVSSEEALNALPIDDDEVDAVVGSRTMNLYDWIEDEAILSLPLVPRHDGCEARLTAPMNTSNDPVARPNPFAALSSLQPETGPGNADQVPRVDQARRARKPDH